VRAAAHPHRPSRHLDPPTGVTAWADDQNLSQGDARGLGSDGNWYDAFDQSSCARKTVRAPSLSSSRAFPSYFGELQDECHAKRCPR